MPAHNVATCQACQVAVRIGLNPALCDVGLQEYRKAQSPVGLLVEAAAAIPETSANAALLRRIDAYIAKS